MSSATSEIQRKISFLRKIMSQEKLAGIRLRGVDWFSWITGGGTSVVIMTSEVGVAQVLITANEAWVLTDCIESSRLRAEELTHDFELTSFAWQDKSAATDFVTEKIGPGTVASDRPALGEVALPAELLRYKLIMQPEEILRYRELGRLAAAAMTEAMAQAEPQWSENDLAAAGAKALWSRGLEPTLILVAGAARGKIFRHPISKSDKIGESAMMVFCARSHGLYANLTRFIFFREMNATERKRFDQLRAVEAEVFKHTKPGATLADAYNGLDLAYQKQGLQNEINFHHQGGPTGYLSREQVATPETNLVIENGMVFAWNPSQPSSKIEDTVLLSESGIEVLTYDPAWPAAEYGGLLRPEPWVRKKGAL